MVPLINSDDVSADESGGGGGGGGHFTLLGLGGRVRTWRVLTQQKAEWDRLQIS